MDWFFNIFSELDEQVERELATCVIFSIISTEQDKVCQGRNMELTVAALACSYDDLFLIAKLLLSHEYLKDYLCTK